MLHQFSLRSVWLVCISVCLAALMTAAAPSNKRAATASAVSKEERANSLDLNDRYMSKKWYEDGNGDNLLMTTPQHSAFLDPEQPDVQPPTGFGFGHRMGGAAPFLPDKWSDLFLAQQQRSFLPSAYNSPAMGVQKRRRLSDDKQQQFLDNYYNNLVEPGRFEWNFNRL